MTKEAPRGRPRASSPLVLQDAAFELFLENGYANTTIEQITQRAGVSRNTFFNYFEAKSDVFWLEVDARLATLPDALDAAPDVVSLIDAISNGLAGLAREFGSSQVPWVLTQYDTIGSITELQTSALTRVLRIARALEAFALKRLTRADVAQTALTAHTRARAQSTAYAITGVIIAAARAWAGAGTGRGSLEPYLLAALDSLRQTL